MDNINNLIMNHIDNRALTSEPICYIWEMNRLNSLKNWPMIKPSAKEMAEAGFYCSNQDTPDTVKCFSCFIELDGWEQTDQPWEEHRNRNLSSKPPCKFVEIGKKESDFTVKDFLDIQKAVILRMFNKKKETITKTALSNHKKKKSALKKELKKMGFS
ncbi:unnamed protein product [Macrosiphum euphorbiae]|uniref:Uncharacterized protein n=2 Tax=Macrosiphum euphorbiae TaxID=13131 RepID=A0AAV0VK31_9HEMI|nr:unnamed protein product [Macrosiphum euphorbiae]